MKNKTNSQHAMVPSTDGAYGQYLPSTEFRDPVPEWVFEEGSLRDYLDVILRRKWLIVNCLLFVFVTVLIFTLSQTKLYTASTTIEIGTKSQNVTKFEEVETFNLNFIAEEYHNTQKQLIHSREIVGRVVDRLDLTNHPVISKAVFGDGESGVMAQIKRMPKALILSFMAKDRQELKNVATLDEQMVKRQELIRYVTDNLKVVSNETSMLIDIAFTSPDRYLSQAVANSVTEEFLRWQMEKKLAASDLARNFLMKQIDRAKINLEKAEEALHRYAKKARIVSMDSKLNSVLGQLEKLNEALASAKADLITKETAYLQARKDGPSLLTEVMESPTIGQLKAEYASIEAEYKRQSVTFHDAYPAVAELIGRMNSIKERIQAEEEKIFRAVQHRYMAAKAKVARMEAQMEAQKQLAMELNERTTQYTIMAREVETNKQIYQSLLERSREIESMAGISSSNIHVVDEACLPLFPSKPNVKRNMILAIVFGLLAGIGLSFLLESLMDCVADPDEISERFEIPILGVVPLSKTENYQPEMTFIKDPRAPFSEAIRTTRVSLQLSGAGARSKSFVITSTMPGEGKTTLASNLALNFAKAGEKVVIVDADMRRPRIHKVFGHNGDGQNKHGLSSYLAGAEEEKLLQRNGVGNLRFITSGPIPPNPVELLASNRFGKLMKDLKNRYDRVIVDGPPHFGFADVLVLSQHVGGVVLVSSMGETKRKSLRHFKKSIMNVNSFILGCIINKLDMTKRYGYHSYYKYYDYYGYGEKKEKKRKFLPLKMHKHTKNKSDEERSEY